MEMFYVAPSYIVLNRNQSSFFIMIAKYLKTDYRMSKAFTSRLKIGNPMDPLTEIFH